MASVDEILKGASGKDSKSQESASGLEQPKKLNQDVTSKMISNYIDKLKARGELAPNSETKKHQTAL